MQKASHRDPIIMMQHVEMYFGSRCILPETSIEFFPGDRTLLVGPSGSGKSTFLNMLSGNIFPSRGVILYHTDTGNCSTREVDFALLSKNRIGSCSTDGLFFEKNTARDNILFPALFGGYTYQRDFFDELVETFEIDDILDHPVSSLSSGERERVNLVRMLAYEPTIVFLDEPCSHLDSRLSDICRTFLAKYSISREATVFVATHTPEIFPEYQRRILFSSGNPSQSI